ncbi:MAG: hypothetical protein RL177_337 [Bacteroidota bacterium]
MKLFLLLVFLLPATLPAQRIDSLLRDEAWAPSTWGIAVQDLATGEWIYRHNAEKLLMPASNTKLYTTAAALVLLGADHQTSTTLYARGDDVILSGGGDPALGGRFHFGDRVMLFRGWAQALKSMGTDTIRGDVLVDDSRYDSLRLGRAWSWDYTTYWYAAEVSALNFNDNCVDLIIVGGKPGEPATITWEPFNTDYVRVINQTLTVPKGERSTTYYNRPWGTNDITVGNRIEEGQTVRYSVAVHDPAMYAGHVLREVFRREGIVVLGGVGRAGAMAGAEMRRLATQASRPLRDIVRVVNKNSQNLYADALLKELSLSDSVTEGSHAEGVARAKHVFAAAGIDTTILQLADGSGLTRVNLVTPDMTVALLRYMHAYPDVGVRNAFIESLPFTGEADYKLGSMFRAPSAPFVRAKTGTINYARALSGYLTTRSGKTYAFSFMVNHYTEPTAAANRLIEAALTELAKD